MFTIMYAGNKKMLLIGIAMMSMRALLTIIYARSKKKLLVSEYFNQKFIKNVIIILNFDLI